MAVLHLKDSQSWSFMFICYLRIVAMAYCATSGKDDKTLSTLVLFKNKESFDVVSSSFLSEITKICKKKKKEKADIHISFVDDSFYYMLSPFVANSTYLNKDQLYSSSYSMLKTIYWNILPFIRFLYEADRESSFILNFIYDEDREKLNRGISLFIVTSIYTWAYKQIMHHYTFIGQDYKPKLKNIIKKAERTLEFILVLQPTIREYLGNVSNFDTLFYNNVVVSRAEDNKEKSIFLKALGLNAVKYLDDYIVNFFKWKKIYFYQNDAIRYGKLMEDYQNLHNVIWQLNKSWLEGISAHVDFPHLQSFMADVHRLRTEFVNERRKVRTYVRTNARKKEAENIIDSSLLDLTILSQGLSIKQNVACNNFKDFYKIKPEILKHIFERLKSVILRVDKEMNDIEWVPDFVCNNYIWETAKKIEKGSNLSKIIVKHILGPDGTNYSNTLSKKYYSAFAGLIKSIGDVKIRDKFQQAGLSCFCKCLTEHRSKQRRIALFHQAINKVLTHEWKIELWVDLYIAIKTGMINKEEMNEHIISILRELKHNGVKNICDIMNEPNTRNITLMYALNIMGYSCSFYKPYKLDSFENPKCLNSCVTSTTKEDFSMKFRITMFFEVTLKDKILEC